MLVNQTLTKTQERRVSLRQCLVICSQPNFNGTNYRCPDKLLSKYLNTRNHQLQITFHPGPQPIILIGWEANNNEVSKFKYILPLVFKASSTKGAFFWRFYFE